MICLKKDAHISTKNLDLFHIRLHQSQTAGNGQFQIIRSAQFYRKIIHLLLPTNLFPFPCKSFPFNPGQHSGAAVELLPHSAIDPCLNPCLYGICTFPLGPCGFSLAAPVSSHTSDIQFCRLIGFSRNCKIVPSM